MDTILGYLGDSDYYPWVVVAGLLLLNAWQALRGRDIVASLKAELAHVFKHGHAPDGKTLVPADAVALVPDKPAAAAFVTGITAYPMPQSNLPPWASDALKRKP